MKRFFNILLILTLLITACSIVNSSSSFAHECLEYKEEAHHFCVEIKAYQEVIKNTDAMPFTITVTSEFDEPDLFLSINALQPSDLEMIQFPNQEVIDDTLQLYWYFNMKAGETVVYKGVVDFENPNRMFEINVDVGLPNQGIFVSNSLTIAFDGEFGQAIYEGTQIAYTPELIIEETVIGYTYTPGPSPTWAPSATWYPQIATREALTQEAAKTAEPQQTEEPSP